MSTGREPGANNVEQAAGKSFCSSSKVRMQIRISRSASVCHCCLVCPRALLRSTRRAKDTNAGMPAAINWPLT